VRFSHSPDVWDAFPELVPGVLAVRGITRDATVEPRVAELTLVAAARLGESSEAELPEIQAWRRAFARMGLKPTQYRCASEALLRRLRKEGSLPRIHPLVDLCNATSLAFAIPVAAFDVARIDGRLEVAHAAGGERYETFSGKTELLEPNEVIFRDRADRAHARRWTNRQSAYSAVLDDTDAVLIVAEALHESAADDVPRLVASLEADLAALWGATPSSAVLTSSAPRFEL
jgi:DNA/RNA-binding domain of Phe-tRNA-synthetase-like protein